MLQNNYDIYLSQADTTIVFLIVGAIVGIQWILRGSTLEAAAARVSVPVRAVLLGLMLTGIAFSMGETRAFIYFQF